MDTPLEHVPMFPLPHGVLLPRELLRLHVFEPRYRRMMEVVRERDRILAIATLVPGYENADEPRPVSSVVGVGRIVKDRVNPDGTSDITVHGLMRAVISDEAPIDEPYREVVVVPHPERDGHPVEAFREARRLLTHLARRVRTKRFRYDLTQPIPVGELVDRIAGGLELRPEQRVGVLQAIDTGDRVDELIDILRERRHSARLLEMIPKLGSFSLSLDGEPGP